MNNPLPTPAPHIGPHPQVCACLTVCDTLRVPAPPSAKLTAPTTLHLPVEGWGGSSLQAAHTLNFCELPAGGAFQTAAPKSPMQLPCYCPLIHCSEAGGGGGGGAVEGF